MKNTSNFLGAISKLLKLYVLWYGKLIEMPINIDSEKQKMIEMYLLCSNLFNSLL